MKKFIFMLLFIMFSPIIANDQHIWPLTNAIMYDDLDSFKKELEAIKPLSSEGKKYLLALVERKIRKVTPNYLNLAFSTVFSLMCLKTFIQTIKYRDRDHIEYKLPLLSNYFNIPSNTVLWLSGFNAAVNLRNVTRELKKLLNKYELQNLCIMKEKIESQPELS